MNIIKKFSLEPYKGSSIYLEMFNTIMKEHMYKKDMFLIENGITPSSYRRASKSEYKIGIDIVDKLTNIFKLRTIDNDELDKLEMYVNRIYFNLCYKYYDTYDDDLAYLDDLSKQNTIVFPIVNLFKLLMLSNSNQSFGNIKKDSESLYEDIIKYKRFLYPVFKDVFDLLEILYSPTALDDAYYNSYNDNGLIYFVLASKEMMRNNYSGSLYYCGLAKTIFTNENNFLRLMYLNLNIMFNLGMLGKFEECKQMAYGQMLTLESLNIKDSLYDNTYKHLLYSLLGLGQYAEIISLLSGKAILESYELICYIIALYNTNVGDYYNYKEKIKLEQLSEDIKDVMQCLEKYFDNEKHRNNDRIFNDNISKVIKKMLKKIFKWKKVE